MTEINQNSKRIDTWIVPLCPRQLKKRTEHFQGGRITDVQFLNLEKAAVMASRHAGTEITPDDFFRSAGLGEIEILLILRRSAKMLNLYGGDTAATAIQYQEHDCIPIPFRACRDFANFGFAAWNVRYELNMEKPYQRYMATHALHPSEPDFEVIEADCRVSGRWTHALADNFLKKAEPKPLHASEPTPQEIDSNNIATVWTVAKPVRLKGYIVPLYRLIATAHREGKPCPTARDVVEEWRVNTPVEIAQMLPSGFDYYDTNGNTKGADLNAIRKAIGRMTTSGKRPASARQTPV